MLNQNCNNNNNNNIVAQSELKKPRVPAASDPEKHCSGFIARPAPETSTSTTEKAEEDEEDSGRERLKRHRMEMGGRVWIPDIWGQESFLKEWADCSAFDSSLVPKGVVSARQALVEECCRANSARGLRIDNRICNGNGQSDGLSSSGPLWPMYKGYFTLGLGPIERKSIFNKTKNNPFSLLQRSPRSRRLRERKDRCFAREKRWKRRREQGEAYGRVSTASSCGGTPYTSPSSSPAPSPVNGLLIMESTSSGSTTMLGRGTRTLLYWGKDSLNDEH